MIASLDKQAAHVYQASGAEGEPSAIALVEGLTSFAHCILSAHSGSYSHS